MLKQIHVAILHLSTWLQRSDSTVYPDTERGLAEKALDLSAISSTAALIAYLDFTGQSPEFEEYLSKRVEEEKEGKWVTK